MKGSAVRRAFFCCGNAKERKDTGIQHAGAQAGLPAQL